MDMRTDLRTLARRSIGISAMILLGTSGILQAQETAPQPEPVYDMAARQRSIENLERHISEREDRMGELAQDIVSLDTRVERRIDRIVDMLQKSKDSKGSKVTVVRTKEKAIEGLSKTIDYYDQKRRALREQLRKETTIPREVLAGDVYKFDEKVEKRVEQIIALTKSFTESEDLKKYDEHTRSRWGWGWSERRISEDWRQNRRDSRHTKLEVQRQREALEKSIASLKSRNAWLKAELEGKNASPEERELFSQDLESNEELIKTREYQIDRLQTYGDQPATKAVSRETAYELADLLDDTAEDVRDDFFTIFAKYAELNREREQVAKLKSNLAARKEWMAKNAGQE